jgi:hypothetical protein
MDGVHSELANKDSQWAEDVQFSLRGLPKVQRENKEFYQAFVDGDLKGALGKAKTSDERKLLMSALRTTKGLRALTGKKGDSAKPAKAPDTKKRLAELMAKKRALLSTVARDDIGNPVLDSETKTEVDALNAEIRKLSVQPKAPPAKEEAPAPGAAPSTPQMEKRLRRLYEALDEATENGDEAAVKDLNARIQATIAGKPAPESKPAGKPKPDLSAKDTAAVEKALGAMMREIKNKKGK